MSLRGRRFWSLERRYLVAPERVENSIKKLERLDEGNTTMEKSVKKGEKLRAPNDFWRSASIILHNSSEVV